MRYPKELLIYVCDYDDGKPIYAVAKNPDDVPENCSGEKVGSYTLNREFQFKVRKELK